MDESKSAAPRRRRIAIGLETLEGRRLMAAGAAQVGIREFTENGYDQITVTGTNQADTIGVVDNGSANPGNITISYGNGQTYTSKGAAAIVEVLGKGGNDNVTYDLTGDLTIARTVLVDLGAGNDQFTANIAGAIANTNGLDLEAYGGAGNDRLTVNQSGATQAGDFVPYLSGDAGNDTLVYNGTGNIAAAASLTPEFAGGAGNDVIRSSYSGQIDGNYIYNLSADGGAGNDQIFDDINVGPGSTGTVGTSTGSPAAVEGGSGNDFIHFAIHVDPTATAVVNAIAVGGAGKDTVERTANVLADKSNEKDTVIT